MIYAILTVQRRLLRVGALHEFERLDIVLDLIHLWQDLVVLGFINAVFRHFRDVDYL